MYANEYTEALQNQTYKTREVNAIMHQLSLNRISKEGKEQIPDEPHSVRWRCQVRGHKCANLRRKSLARSLIITFLSPQSQL